MNKRERRIRTTESRLRELRLAHPKLGYWSLRWRWDAELARMHAEKYGRPKHDALVARITAHRDEVKALRK